MKLSVFVFALLELLSAAEAFRWTLHRSCYSNEVYRDGIIAAMKTVKARSAFIAPKLDTFFHPNYRRLAQLLVKTEDYSSKARVLKERFANFTKVDGPFGLETGFADSPEWQNREKPVPADFVIYCAPQISWYDKDSFKDNPLPYDLARLRVLREDNSLVLIQRDIDAGGWHDPNLRHEASTHNAPPSDVFSTAAERAKIPDTITFNPIWLNWRLEPEQAELGGLFWTSRTLEAMKRSNALETIQEQLRQSGREWVGNNRITPVDSFMDLAGTLHHEMFHLSAFGKLEDIPADRAYRWTNNYELHKEENPELLALLALIFDLKGNHNIVVQATGELKQSS